MIAASDVWMYGILIAAIAFIFGAIVAIRVDEHFSKKTYKQEYDAGYAQGLRDRTDDISVKLEELITDVRKSDEK